ncbi:hypothetical protein IWZ03DRAFT_436742 [Phyllosticta citriasiana]|uniref:Uncharacterized protein n=1 Tax=Phyllosticta citriasiana TaxID=595635 RepID=A0ABR1K8X5_9PEZI
MVNHQIWLFFLMPPQQSYSKATSDHLTRSRTQPHRPSFHFDVFQHESSHYTNVIDRRLLPRYMPSNSRSPALSLCGATAMLSWSWSESKRSQWGIAWRAHGRLPWRCCCCGGLLVPPSLRYFSKRQVQRDAAITDSALNEVDKLVRSLIHPENFSPMASVLPVPTYKLPEMSNGRNTDPARISASLPILLPSPAVFTLVFRSFPSVEVYVHGSGRVHPFFWDISALPSNPILHLVLISPSAPTPDYCCGRSRTSFDGVSDGLVAPTSAHLDTRCRPYPGGCFLGVLAREPGRPFCEDEGYDTLVATIALSTPCLHSICQPRTHRMSTIILNWPPSRCLGSCFLFLLIARVASGVPGHDFTVQSPSMISGVMDFYLLSPP